MRPNKNKLLINALATEIKLRRRALDFSQEDLAGHCRLDKPHISLVELGHEQSTLDVLLRLADADKNPTNTHGLAAN